MRTGIKFSTLLGWFATAVLQGTLALLVVYVIYIFFPGLDISTRWGWLLTLLAIWLGFTLGISLGGWIYLRMRRMADSPAVVTRMMWTAASTFLPLAVLAVIGSRYDPAETQEFAAAILENWEPRLSQAALWLGILGFHLPGMLRRE
ncbi:MAG: hypothetical protein JSV61_11400 [Anaerolineales bacterium]|nr:MAG: hypothetical protein JSV61_11400 [Anaerolineales bacterium]